MCKFAGCSYPSNSQKLLEIHEEMKEPFHISSLERHYTIRQHKTLRVPFDLDQFLDIRLVVHTNQGFLLTCTLHIRRWNETIFN